MLNSCETSYKKLHQHVMQGKVIFIYIPLSSKYIPSGLNTCCFGSSLWGCDATDDVLLNLFAPCTAACLNSECRFSIS